MSEEENRKKLYQKEYHKKYYQAHKRNLDEYTTGWWKSHVKQYYALTKKHREKRRLEVLSHYSDGEIKCKMCGYTDIRALSIDHILGKGTTHRKQTKGGGYYLYSWLKKNNYPDGYQVLCMNCQFIKRHTNHETL